MGNIKEQKPTVTAYCGLDCATCEFVESSGCKGCIATKGFPFHAEKEPCSVAKCAIEKGAAFCGACKKFPCKLLESFSNDPEYGDNPKGARIDRCRKLKSALNAEKEV